MPWPNPIGSEAESNPFARFCMCSTNGRSAFWRSELAVPDLDLAVYVVLRGVEAIVHNAFPI
jgi:hypothetical protein